jgi:CubicO group peptidase (beta-lactamase class C family)
MARTFCCLLATPRDWVRVGRLIMNQGKWEGREVISASWIDAMSAPSPTNPAYGFQIWRGISAPSRSYGSGPAPALPIGEPYAVDDLLILDGAVGQRVYISRKSDLVIVRLGAIVPDFHDSRLPNAILRGLF